MRTRITRICIIPQVLALELKTVFVDSKALSSVLRYWSF
jgi:hypothetical protein